MIDFPAESEEPRYGITEEIHGKAGKKTVKENIGDVQEKPGYSRIR
jgi:hypothetical protein